MVAGMSVVEKDLLDGYVGITGGLHYISVVNGSRLIWCYRRGENGDGCNPVVDRREDAHDLLIELTWERVPFSDGCENHPNLERMYREWDEVAYG